MAIRNGAFPEIPDDELVLIALLGNMACFDELVRRYRGAVTRVAWQVVGSKAAAEDIAQDAFLLAYKALPQLQEPANFAGWLYAITRHRARRVAGRESRSETVDLSDIDRLILDYCPELTVNPAEEVIKRSDRAWIPGALRSLPDTHRIVMELRYFEEWTVSRIGEFLSLPVTTVKWRLHSGREMMRRYLARESQMESTNDKKRNKPAAPVRESDRNIQKESYNHNERKRHGHTACKAPAA
jgi:RNA polymerase sigma-70 factor, ECF subfamily